MRLLLIRHGQTPHNVTGALEPLIMTPAEFSALIKRDYDKYGKLVRDVGIKM